MAIREFRLGQDLDSRVDELPYGRRRLVAIARSVATVRAILLLDEPGAGLSSIETSELSDLIRNLAGTLGIGILLVEHDMSMIMSVCDRVVVLENSVRRLPKGPPRKYAAIQL